MLDIAWTSPPEEIDRNIAAANAWRLPYWDWAIGNKEVPWFFMQDTIAVNEPGHPNTLIYNPLYTYQFHGIPSSEFDEKVGRIGSTYVCEHILTTD